MALIRYSRARWRLFWLLTSCVFLYAVFLLSFHIEPASEAFHEFHKCPACFGDALCPHMRDVKLSGWYSRSVLRFFNVKNVFMGGAERYTRGSQETGARRRVSRSRSSLVPQSTM
ncbi:hypothetical protein MTO96_047505 [Rhipicephalus appendiculatus]